MLKPEDLPSPDSLIAYADGSVSALMFHFASEESLPDIVAAEWGFDVALAALEYDDSPRGMELWDRYEEGENIIPDWEPEIPPGWQLGGKWDTEDGPIAVLLLKRSDDEKRIEPTVSDVGTA